MADTPNEVASEVVGPAAAVPSMNLMDQIVADTNAALVQSSDTQVNLLKSMGVVDSIIGETIKLQEQTASDRALVTSTQQAADLKAQQYRIQVANKAGIDPTKTTDFLLETVEKFTESAKEVQKRQEVVKKKEDSRLFDDPIQFLTDAVTLPGARRELRSSVNNTATYGNQISQINQIVTQGANVSMQIKESTTAASADAMSRIAANESLIAAQKTAFDGIKYNVDAMNASMGMTKERLALQSNVQSMRQQAEAQKLVLAKFANEKYEFDVRKAERDAAVEAKKQGKEIDAYQTDMINIGRAARGLPPLSGTGIKSALQIFKAGGKGSEELYMDYQNGERTATTGNTFLGGSAAQSIENIKNHQFQFPPGVERTLNILKAADDALAADPKMVGVKDEKLRDKYLNDFAAARVLQDYNAPVKTPDNIFYTGDLSNYFAVPTVKQLPVVQKLLIPASASGVKLDDPTTVFNLGVSAVKNKTITSTEFQDLATVYQMANNLALRAANPLGFGIALPNGGNGLIGKLSPFGGPLEITNPTEIGRYLSQQLSADAQEEEDAKSGGARAIYNRSQQRINPFAVNRGQ